MKKIFLTVLASLALCSYSYAQDDDDEYEDDDTPAYSGSHQRSRSPEQRPRIKRFYRFRKCRR